MNMRVDAQISKVAGNATSNGLILFLILTESAALEVGDIGITF
jgi:hypothetical protein